MDPVRTTRLAQSIADHFEQLILEGVLGPSERLASERDLAARLEVSRPSLREALGILEQKGLVRTSKTGTVVSDFLAPLTSPLAALLQSSPRATKDYFEYRETLEARAAELAALRATPLDRKAIADCLEKMEAAHNSEEPDTESAADADLHVLIYEASHNVVLLQIMRAFSEMLRLGIFYNRRLLYGRADVRDALISQHKAIAEAILTGDPSRAAEAAVAHVRYTAATVEKLQEQEQRLEVALRRLGRRELIAGSGGSSEQK